MFRLALTNAPIRNTSARRISSTVGRWPAPPRGRSGISLQWARIERRHNSSNAGSPESSGAETAKEAKTKAELSSKTAERLEEPAKPTFSSKETQHTASSAPKPSKSPKNTNPQETVQQDTSTRTQSLNGAVANEVAGSPKSGALSSVAINSGADEVSATEKYDASKGPSLNDLTRKADTISDAPLAQAQFDQTAFKNTPLSEVRPTDAKDVIEAAGADLQNAAQGQAPIAENGTLTDSTKPTSNIKAKKLDEMEEFDEDEDIEFENIDATLEEATVKLFQSQEFAESLQSVSEPSGPLETPDFGGLVSTTSQPSTGRLRTREELGDNFTEAEWHSAIVHGRGIHLPFHHPRTHSIPAAVIHFRSHSPSQLALFTHFAQHAAASLGIPCSGVAALPTKRTLWTVIKGPFVHKKTQENFERRVHKRAIKVWDAHPDVVDLWASYLRKHAMGGVGMRVIKWTRAPVGVGEQMMNEAKKGWKLRKVANSADKVKKLGEQIVDMEMRKDLPAVEASLPKS